MALEEVRIESSEQAKRFIDEQVAAISDAVGDGYAINALSGGVDSSAVTMLGPKALGDRLLTYL